jgi:DNA-binding transcriptional MocR family regulator
MMRQVALDRWGHLRFHGLMLAPASLSDVLGDSWRRPGGSATALADALRSLVVDGRLAVRTRIPSERALAPELGVSRGTVSRAYDRLRADGFLVSARGSGSWLTLPEGSSPAPGWVGTVSAPAWGTDLSIASLPGPEPLLGEAAARAAAALARHAPSLGYVAAGLPELRDAVARRFTERGAPTTADQILVTAGAQHALHLLLKLLCAPGDRVLVDAPAYPRTLSALRGARARPVAVPLTPSGWDLDAWERSLSAAVPRLAVVMPDFHNPTGLTMAPEDRDALARACATAGVVAICDETNAELRLDGPATPAPLAAADPGGAVVTVGSMSKAAWGGLRLGWVRAHPRMIRELAAVRGDVDMSSPVLEQLLGLELFARWDEVVESRRALLLPRRAAMLAALAEHAPAWSTRRPHGGLSVWVRLPAPVATRLATAAAREGLTITPGPSFSVDGTFERHLRLPYTAAPEVLEPAVATLASLATRLGAVAEPDTEPAAAV